MEPENNPVQTETQGNETATAVVETSPAETPAEKEERIYAGKFKSAEDLEKSYQELESMHSSRANDPNWIYERADALGLTGKNEGAEEAPITQPQQDVSKVVQTELEKERAKEKYPQLQRNEAYQYAVTAYINRGMSPMKAADKFFAELDKERQEAAREAAEAEKNAAREQDKAQTISTSSNITSDDSEEQRLIAISKNKFNPGAAEKAIIELQKRRMLKK